MAASLMGGPPWMAPVLRSMDKSGRGGEMEVVRYWCSCPGVNGGKKCSLNVY